MATKYEIKKFIEARKQEALSRLDNAHNSDIDVICQKFLSEFNVLIESVKTELTFASDCFDDLIATAGKAGITYQNKYYSNPRKEIDDAYLNISSEEIVKYFDIPAIGKLKIKFEKLTEETEHEYNRLIAVTKNMSAKDGIKLLQDLGFNTTDLETVKETTALTINIDVKKLFITKEVK